MRHLSINCRFRRLLFCFIAALLLSSCHPSPEAPLRIGSNNWPGYQPLYLSQSLGYYQNSPIKLIPLTSTLEVLHALRNGNLEGAALTLDETLTLIEDGYDLSVVLVTDFSSGGDALLAKPEIESLEQLRGKRIGLEYTTVGAILLDGALSSVDLTPADIKIINCTLDTHIDCYDSVDAIVTFEPAKTKLEKMGAKVLFISRKIPKRIIDVLVIKNDVLSMQPQALKTLLSGYFKAIDYVESNPETAMKFMATQMEISPVEARAALDGLHLADLQENQRLLASSSAEHLSPLAKTAENLSFLCWKKAFSKNRLTSST